MTDTHRKIIVPVSLETRSAIGGAQWLLECDKDPTRYKENNLDLLVCGEEAFACIAEDLKRAKASVEIICWGFDPAMELDRTRTRWPRGDTWGGLLADVAAGKYNGGRPVQVRLLSWYGFIGHFATNNMPGYRQTPRYEIWRAIAQGEAGWVVPTGEVDYPEPTNPRDRREMFNATWYRAAVAGKTPNLSLRTREGDAKAVTRSVQEEKARRDPAEHWAMTSLPTDHQKTILIDYEHEGGSHAVGFVMGLNSVTDYWDTTQHLFRDPRRGASWEGAGGDEPGLKPYQDYACRIRGQSLVALSKNFTDAWNRAKGNGDKLARTHDLLAPPTGLSAALKGAHQAAQIVRTLPEDADESIKRLYKQASSFARHFIYIENQYFQSIEWATALREVRGAFVAGWQNAGHPTDTIPDLHVMAVIPTPERRQMVPATYDTVRTLGQADSMPNQDKLTEDELKAWRPKQARWQAHVDEQHAKGQSPDPDMAPPMLSLSAQNAEAAGDKEAVNRRLDSMGLRTLTASLWSFDHDWQSTQIKARVVADEGRGGERPTERVKAPDDTIPAARYREIYIHSKLMLIDDSMFTLGSANLNLRSMIVDAELNIASDDRAASTSLRKRVWGLHTGGTLDGGDGGAAMIKSTFENWEKLASKNSSRRAKDHAPIGFIHSFHDDRSSSIRLG